MKRKSLNDSFGFNICGDALSEFGVFISSVREKSLAEKNGFTEGDQILFVNDIDFTKVKHEMAVKILKSSLQISIVLRYFPYNFQRQKNLY